ncbi:aminotransferase class IV [Demequina sp. NBRC 110057]|uniref:aminotransferase class IV n=1 Tax=Demequina sp. NBRC 110057 TaxID=1570346 RepID=UPI0009FBF911|nr:aminotransferase class IV [Demequina sp. NBRC 110057]
MTTVVWAEGSLHDPGEPLITALDHGVTVGDGIFETMAVRDGRVFALTRHLARMAYGADRLGIGPVDADAIHGAVDEVMEAGQGTLTRLRVTVTSGTGPMGSARGDGPHSLLVTGVDAPRPRTCHAVRSPWRRNERGALTGVKSTSYAENAVMVAYAREHGADEAILANTQGHLCEGTASNVILERDGEIVTPPLASGCLAGITRGLALEWGAAAGIPVRAAAPGELTMSVLDEVLAGDTHLAVTSSTRGVQHVASLDGKALEPGTMLRRLAAQFELRAEQEPDPGLPRSK